MLIQCLVVQRDVLQLAISGFSPLVTEQLQMRQEWNFSLCQRGEKYAPSKSSYPERE